MDDPRSHKQPAMDDFSSHQRSEGPTYDQLVAAAQAGFQRKQTPSEEENQIVEKQQRQRQLDNSNHDSVMNDRKQPAEDFLDIKNAQGKFLKDTPYYDLVITYPALHMDEEQRQEFFSQSALRVWNNESYKRLHVHKWEVFRVTFGRPVPSMQDDGLPFYDTAVKPYKGKIPELLAIGSRETYDDPNKRALHIYERQAFQAAFKTFKQSAMDGNGGEVDISAVVNSHFPRILSVLRTENGVSSNVVSTLETIGTSIDIDTTLYIVIEELRGVFLDDHVAVELLQQASEMIGKTKIPIKTNGKYHLEAPYYQLILLPAIQSVEGRAIFDRPAKSVWSDSAYKELHKHSYREFLSTHERPKPSTKDDGLPFNKLIMKPLQSREKKDQQMKKWILSKKPSAILRNEEFAALGLYDSDAVRHKLNYLKRQLMLKTTSSDGTPNHLARPSPSRQAGVHATPSRQARLKRCDASPSSAAGSSSLVASANTPNHNKAVYDIINGLRAEMVRDGERTDEMLSINRTLADSQSTTANTLDLRAQAHVKSLSLLERFLSNEDGSHPQEHFNRTLFPAQNEDNDESEDDIDDENYPPHAGSVGPRSGSFVNVNNDLADQDLSDVDEDEMTQGTQGSYQTALQEMPAVPTTAATAFAAAPPTAPNAMASAAPPPTAPAVFGAAASRHGGLTKEPTEQGTGPTLFETVPAAGAPAGFASAVAFSPNAFGTAASRHGGLTVEPTEPGTGPKRFENVPAASAPAAFAPLAATASPHQDPLGQATGPTGLNNNPAATMASRRGASVQDSAPTSIFGGMWRNWSSTTDSAQPTLTQQLDSSFGVEAETEGRAARQSNPPPASMAAGAIQLNIPNRFVPTLPDNKKKRGRDEISGGTDDDADEEEKRAFKSARKVNGAGTHGDGDMDAGTLSADHNPESAQEDNLKDTAATTEPTFKYNAPAASFLENGAGDSSSAVAPPNDHSTAFNAFASADLTPNRTTAFASTGTPEEPAPSLGAEEETTDITATAGANASLGAEEETTDITATAGANASLGATEDKTTTTTTTILVSTPEHSAYDTPVPKKKKSTAPVSSGRPPLPPWASSSRKRNTSMSAASATSSSRALGSSEHSNPSPNTSAPGTPSIAPGLRRSPRTNAGKYATKK